MTRKQSLAYTAYSEQPFRFPNPDSDIFAWSEFAADFSLSFDDSFIEMEFKTSPVKIATLIRDLDFCGRIPNELAAAAKKKRIIKSNYIIALPYFMYDRSGYLQPHATRLNDYYNRRAPLAFIGSFETKEPIADHEPFELPMAKKRVLLVKYDLIAANFNVFGLERNGSSVMVYSGVSSKKLKRKEQNCSSPKEANQFMANSIAEKLTEHYQIKEREWSWRIG